MAMAPGITCSPAAKAQGAAQESPGRRSTTEPATAREMAPAAGWHYRPAVVTRYSPRATAILNRRRPHCPARVRAVPRQVPPEHRAAAERPVHRSLDSTVNRTAPGTSTALSAAGGSGDGKPWHHGSSGAQQVPAPPVHRRAILSAMEQQGAMALFPTCPVHKMVAPADNRVDSKGVNQALNRDRPVQARTIKRRGDRGNKAPAVWACNPIVRRARGAARPAGRPAVSRGNPGGQAGMMPAAGNGQSSPMMSPSGPAELPIWPSKGQQGQQTASNSMADSRARTGACRKRRGMRCRSRGRYASNVVLTDWSCRRTRILRRSKRYRLRIGPRIQSKILSRPFGSESTLGARPDAACIGGRNWRST